MSALEKVECNNTIPLTGNRQLFLDTIDASTEKIKGKAIEIFYASLDSSQNDKASLKKRVEKSYSLSHNPEKNLLKMMTACNELPAVMANFTNRSFFDQNISSDNQEIIRELPKRVKGLFWTVVMKVYAKLENEKAFLPITFSCVLMGHKDDHVKVISEIALPIVLESIKTLDAHDKTIINVATHETHEANENGIHLEVAEFFSKFNVKL